MNEHEQEAALRRIGLYTTYVGLISASLMGSSRPVNSDNIVSQTDHLARHMVDLAEAYRTEQLGE